MSTKKTCTSSARQPKTRVNNASLNASNPSRICSRFHVPIAFYNNRVDQLMQ